MDTSRNRLVTCCNVPTSLEILPLNISLLNLTPGNRYGTWSAHPRLCHPTLGIINIRLLQRISCMCLSGGSVSTSQMQQSLTLPSGSGVAQMVCCGQGGSWEEDPGTVCPREGTTFSRMAEAILLSLLCVSGWHGELENVFLSFFLKTIHFNLSHSGKT